MKMHIVEKFLIVQRIPTLTNSWIASARPYRLHHYSSVPWFYVHYRPDFPQPSSI